MRHTAYEIFFGLASYHAPIQVFFSGDAQMVFALLVDWLS